MIEVFSLEKQRETSHAVSIDWNPLVESSEALEREYPWESTAGKLNMKYNPVKKHIHTDVITYYTRICLHIQSMFHVRGRHEEFSTLDNATLF